MKKANPTHSRTLVIHNDVKDLVHLGDFLHEVCSGIHFSSGRMILLRAALDEAITNSVLYAYDSPGGEISLEATRHAGSLRFVLTDSGRPFNPLEYTPPDPQDGDVRVGGLGIPLIKNTFDSISYRREGDRNILTMNKNF